MDFHKTNSRISASTRVPGYGIQIGYYSIHHPVVSCSYFFSYRTLSVRVEEKQLPQKPKASADPADAIASIDVHLITPEEVYTRYSTHPVHGLDNAAVLRKTQDGKNVISAPPTQYWKKALNYVFGGFNFLMWIAFILTLVSFVIDRILWSLIVVLSCHIGPSASHLRFSCLVWPFFWWVLPLYVPLSLIICPSSCSSLSFPPLSMPW